MFYRTDIGLQRTEREWGWIKFAKYDEKEENRIDTL